MNETEVKEVIGVGEESLGVTTRQDTIYHVSYVSYSNTKHSDLLTTFTVKQEVHTLCLVEREKNYLISSNVFYNVPTHFFTYFSLIPVYERERVQGKS